MADATQMTTHLTRAGFGLLAKALAGSELKYTKVLLGDSFKNGAVVEPTRAQQYEFTALIHSVGFEAPLTDYTLNDDGSVTISFTVSNANLTTGFFMREVGLFAEDPDTHADVLYCYGNVGSYCDWIPSSDGATIFEMDYGLTTAVSEAQNISVVLNASSSYVIRATYNEHINSTNPHPNAPSLKNTVSTATEFWVTKDDRHLHPLTVADAKTLIIGDSLTTLATDADLTGHVNSATPHPNAPSLKNTVSTATEFWVTSGDRHLHPLTFATAKELLVPDEVAQIPQLAQRLSQSEINVANLYMQLNAESEMGLKPNLLLFEDFTDYDAIDRFSCKVTGIDGETLTLESDRGLLVDRVYRLTDGVRDEFVRVTAVAKSGDTYTATLAVAPTKTYTIANAKLQRTTASVRDDRAYGAGWLRSPKYSFAADVWRGQSAETSATLTLATTLANKGSFTVTEDGTFDANGQFTLKE